MKDFGSSGVSDDMVLGKDENLFCIVEAQTAIKRLDLEPKITVILGNEGDRSAALLTLPMRYYSYHTCGTTPVFLPSFADFTCPQRLGDSFLGVA